MTRPVQSIFPSVDGEMHGTPPLFIDDKTGVNPADLTRFAPHGNGVYGYQKGIQNPFLAAPPQDAIGGLLHFGNDIEREEFDAFMSITGVCPKWIRNNGQQHRDYLAFYQESDNPGKDGYLAQVRITSKFALRYMFGGITDVEYENFKEQELLMSDTLWSFIENERKKYGASFGGAKLNGLFGGDGDFAQEELCFGFMVENSYYHIYRIWSRARLVTK